MSYTPVELRHVRVGRSLFGYNRAMVEQVIEEVADSFENAWRERGELTDQVHALEKQLGELKSREELLTHTLVAAEQAASDVRDHAKREAEMILAEAHSESRSIVRTAQNERERLFAEARRIEALLRSALGMVQESSFVTTPPAEQQPAEQPVPAPAEDHAPEADSWPAADVVDVRRDDTREFDPIPLPAVVETVEESQPERSERPVHQAVGGDSRDFDWGD